MSSSPTYKLNTACQRCRRRKVKCDLTAPQCGACARAAVSCVSSGLNSSRAAASLPPGYLDTLEAEVARLENQISQAQVSTTHSVHQLPGDIGSSNNAPGHGRNPRATFDWSTIHEATPGILHPQLSFGLNRLVKCALHVDNRFPFHSRQSNTLFEYGRPTAGMYQARPFLQEYLTSYIDTVHKCLPFLDHATIRACRFLQPGDRVDSPVILMVLAVGAVLSSDCGPVATYHSIELFTAATQRYVEASRSADMETLHFLILAALFSMFNAAGGSTWHLIGLAVQVSVSLALHSETSSPDHTSGETIDQTAFWSAYVLDRVVSVSLGRPPGINDLDISTELPQHQPSPTCLHCLVYLASSNPNHEDDLQHDDRLSENYPAVYRMRSDSPQDGARFRGTAFYDSLTLQLVVWAVSDPSHLKKQVLFENWSSHAIMDILDLLLQRSQSHIRAYSALPWTAAYAIFHAAVLRRLVTKWQTVQTNAGLIHAQANPRDCQNESLSLLDSFAIAFRGLEELNLLFKALLQPQRTSALNIKTLEPLQNKHSRDAARALIGLISHDLSPHDLALGSTPANSRAGFFGNADE